MIEVIIHLGTLAIVVSGLLVIVGARKVGWRVFAVGVILIVAASWLGQGPATQQHGQSDVAAR